jgi:hypothetical protein
VLEHDGFGIADQLRHVPRRHAELEQQSRECVPEDMRRWPSALKCSGFVEDAMDSPTPQISHRVEAARSATGEDPRAQTVLAPEQALIQPVVYPGE